MSDLSSTGYGVDLGSTAQGWDSSLAQYGVQNLASNQTSSGFNWGGSLFPSPNAGQSLQKQLDGGQGITGSVGSAAKAVSSIWSDLWLRSVVIILGFIFTAAGLSMFRTDGSKT